jgi:hypothetical protein
MAWRQRQRCMCSVSWAHFFQTPAGLLLQFAAAHAHHPQYMAVPGMESPLVGVAALRWQPRMPLLPGCVRPFGPVWSDTV